MLFFIRAKKFHQLLREYMLSNSLLLETDMESDSCLQGLAVKCQNLGFSAVDEFCRYILLQPYQTFVTECKSLLCCCKPVKFYQQKAVLDFLNQGIINPLIEKVKENKSESKFSIMDFVKKIFTGGKKESERDNFPRLRVLSIENGAGEETYSLIFRLLSLVDEDMRLDITVLQTVSAGNFSLNSDGFDDSFLESVPGDIKEKFFVKNDSGKFFISGNIEKRLQFTQLKKNFDISEKDFSRPFHLIFLNNSPQYYSGAVIGYIIKKLANHLSSGGFLFVPSRQNLLGGSSQALDTFESNGVIYYNRNNTPCEKVPLPFCREIESLENRIIFCRALFNEKEYDKAISEIDSILKTYGENFSANYIMGDLQVLRGNIENAVGYYKKSLQLDPSFLPLHFNLAILLKMLNQKEEAEAEIQKAVDLLDSFDINILKNVFRIGYGFFVEQCRNIKNVIKSDESITLEKVISQIESNMEPEEDFPDILVEDILNGSYKMKLNTPKKAQSSKKESLRETSKEGEVQPTISASPARMKAFSAPIRSVNEEKSVDGGKKEKPMPLNRENVKVSPPIAEGKVEEAEEVKASQTFLGEAQEQTVPSKEEEQAKKEDKGESKEILGENTASKPLESRNQETVLKKRRESHLIEAPAQALFLDSPGVSEDLVKYEQVLKQYQQKHHKPFYDVDTVEPKSIDLKAAEGEIQPVKDKHVSPPKVSHHKSPLKISDAYMKAALKIQEALEQKKKTDQEESASTD